MGVQAIALGLAAGIWAIAIPPVVEGLLGAYLVAWLIVALWPRRRHRRVLAGLAVLGVVMGGWRLATNALQLVAYSQILDRTAILNDRWHLDRRPALHPRVVRDDRPQRLFVYAPGARRVRLSLLTDAEGTDLGHGLFRIDFVPTKRFRRSGPVEATLWIDETQHHRTIHAVRAWAWPTRVDGNPTSGRGCAVSPSSNEAYLIERRGHIRRLRIEDRPLDCQIAGDRWYVLHPGHVTERSWTTAQIVRRYPTPTDAAFFGPSPLRSPSAAWTVWGGDEATSWTRSGTVTRRLPFDADAVVRQGVFVVASRSRQGSLHRLRLHHDRIEADGPPLTLGRPAIALAPGPDDQIGVLVSDFRPRGDRGPNHHVEDQRLLIDVAQWQLVDRQPTLRRLNGNIVSGAGPSALLYDERWHVVFGGSGDFDGLRLPPELHPPTAIASLGVGHYLIASGPNGGLGVATSTTIVATAHLLPADLASQDPKAYLRRRGAQAFWTSTRSGLSCQTCHLDADSDHALHEIGHGAPRATLSVRGIAGTAPYLRGASYATVAELESLFAQTVLGGYDEPWAEGGFSRGEAIQQFVNDLVSAGPRPLNEAVWKQGIDAFVAAGCNECHRFAAFTDLAQIAAKAMFPTTGEDFVMLDTPSLIGVGRRGRWLHDGRARSLRSIFEVHDPDRRHGAYFDLTARQREQLLWLLEAL